MGKPASSSSAVSVIPSMNYAPWSKLRLLHTIAGVLHAGIAITVGVGGNRDLTVQLFVFPLTAQNRVEGDWLVRPEGSVVEAGQVHIVTVIVVFELLTAFFHLANAWLWPAWYTEQIERERAPVRWLEYALSAPLMVLLIGIFSGIVNTYVLLLLMTLMASTVGFGYLAEDVGLRAHLLGWVPQLVLWGCLVTQFVRYANQTGLDVNGNVLNEMPQWVYALFVLEVLLFWSFAFVQLYVILRKPAYVYGELAYVTLSFVSKAVLAFVIFGGTMGLEIDNRD